MANLENFIKNNINTETDKKINNLLRSIRDNDESVAGVLCFLKTQEQRQKFLEKAINLKNMGEMIRLSLDVANGDI